MTVKIIGNGESAILRTIYIVAKIDALQDKKLWRLSMEFSDEPILIPRQRKLLVEWSV